MPGRSKAHEPQEVILQKYDESAQALVETLELMRQHLAKCAKCKSLPVITEHARPCLIMTFHAIWATSYWRDATKQVQFVQGTLFDEPQF